jgi:iron complex transport system ATP-binding protein
MYEARGVRIRIGAKAILDGASISLAPGKFVAVVGPNGAGKSSLLKVLAGERHPDAGAITLDGVELRRIAAETLSKRRAVLPQSVVVAFPFLAREIVALGLPQYFPRQPSDELVSRALETVDMMPAAEQVYDTLSGGERQRIQLARVMVQLWANGGKGYLLLDEPTASLDLPHQLSALRIARAHAAGGGGVLAVLHDLNLAVMAADEIVAMRAGRVIAHGTPAEIVTDGLIKALYDVNAYVRSVPEGPFLLPQGIHPA